ncbi:MAG: hypothetical protein IJZ01_04340 [Paraprevotella sp.]|nr:hypothetical protein [Paraprevotella sp.]
MKRHGFLLTSAKLLSMAFRPYYIPTVGLIALFTFTYLNILPWAYKLTVLLMVYSFTVILPRICVFVYRKINGWAPHQFRLREYRAIPYMLFIISYIACLHLMIRLHLPHYMCGILVSALLIQAICATVNIWWKISIHSAGAGGIIGALIAYSILFMFNPIWWLCLMIVLSGAVGTSRMILRQHSLMQIVLGTIVGVVCGFGGIILT